MGTKKQNATTGNQAFDNVIESVQLLHEYIYAVDDETTFALVLGGAINEEDVMQGISVNVGNFQNPQIFDTAVKVLTNAMRENDLISRLIIQAFENYRNKGNVKVVKLSVDSPLEALIVLKSLIENGGKVPDLDQLPPELAKVISQKIPDLAELLSSKIPSFEEMLEESEPCDNPLCPVCAFKRNKGMYN
ncbi:hypothetical protein CLV62_10488 [Dysgonomonas alginatilytica]|uniref:Uncharacterized protein n=1 Tax=Dysgonomonas alginatilytica TaxID=1605892 RepID=A0A2V3PR20_9BACT|nr:hypothetical protein [Dysgonomonas alginatilytica]PXV66827.1 hypothetical protein CLV62_10488 [Dysgonomonas alginatilytica]